MPVTHPTAVSVGDRAYRPRTRSAKRGGLAAAGRSAADGSASANRLPRPASVTRDTALRSDNLDALGPAAWRNENEPKSCSCSRLPLAPGEVGVVEGEPDRIAAVKEVLCNATRRQQ